MQAQMAIQQAQAQLLQAQAAESQSRANKYTVEADIAPKETFLKYSDMDKDGALDVGFTDKLNLAKMLMEEERFELEKAERVASMEQERQKQVAAQREQEMLQKMLSQNQQQIGQVTIEEGAQDV